MTLNYPLPGTYFPSCLCSESPPRFEYLAAAHRAYSMSTGIAGISLQRQAGRMDAYPEELEGKRVRPGKNQPLAALKPTTYRDTLYLFPHEHVHVRHMRPPSSARPIYQPAISYPTRGAPLRPRPRRTSPASSLPRRPSSSRAGARWRPRGSETSRARPWTRLAAVRCLMKF